MLIYKFSDIVNNSVYTSPCIFTSIVSRQLVTRYPRLACSLLWRLFCWNGSINCKFFYLFYILLNLLRQLLRIWFLLLQFYLLLSFQSFLLKTIFWLFHIVVAVLFSKSYLWHLDQTSLRSDQECCFVSYRNLHHHLADWVIALHPGQRRHTRDVYKQVVNSMVDIRFKKLSRMTDAYIYSS